MSKSVGDGYGESTRRSRRRNLRSSLEVVKPAFLRPLEFGQATGLEKSGLEKKRARLRSPEPAQRAKPQRTTSVIGDEDVGTGTSSSHIDYDSAFGEQGEAALAGNTVAAFETASHDLPGEVDELPVELYEHSTFELANFQQDKAPAQRFDLDEVADPELDLIAEGRRALPVWLISMLIHLFVLMCLAVMTFGGDRPSGILLELISADEAIEFSIIEVQPQPETVTMEAEQDLAQSSVEAELSGTFQVSEMWSEDSDSLLALSEEFGDVELGQQLDIGDAVVEPSGMTFFGLKSYGDQFVFVIDCSSSMTQNFRWERAVYELTKAVKGLDEDKEFLVLLYNSRSYIMMDTPEAEMALIPATPANKDRLYDWLDQQWPNGGTFPAHAMQVGLAFDPSAIFLLSDGEIRDRTDDILKRKNRPHKRSNGKKEKTPIHTVLLGNGFGREQMKSIAKFNNGKFRWAQ